MQNKILLVLCYLLTVAIVIGWADEPITIRHGTAFDTRAANIALIVRIQKNTDNRELDVVCESPSLYRSSQKNLDGENTPIELRFEFKLDHGNYECKAILSRKTDGEEKKFATSIRFFIP